MTLTGQEKRILLAAVVLGMALGTTLVKLGLLLAVTGP